MINVEQILNKLKHFWQAILRTPQVGIHDSFYKLGGDTLLMAALKQELCNEYELNEQQFFDTPMTTLYDQLSTLQKLLNVKAPSIISTMREGKRDLSLVLVHPIGGTLFAFMRLIRQLLGEQQILGIHDPIIKKDYRLFSTIEAQAQFYTDALMPHIGKEVMIAGYSSGGTVGCEMTKALQNRGVTIKHLILFDSWAKMPFGLDFRDNFKSIIARQIDQIRPYEFLDQHQIAYWHDVLWNRMRLVFAYKPTKILVDASVFAPQESVSEYKVDSAAYEGWSSVFNHVNLMTVAGNHENMLDGNDVSPIAHHMNSLLGA